MYQITFIYIPAINHRWEIAKRAISITSASMFGWLHGTNDVAGWPQHCIELTYTTDFYCRRPAGKTITIAGGEGEKCDGLLRKLKCWGLLAPRKLHLISRKISRLMDIAELTTPSISDLLHCRTYSIDSIREPGSWSRRAKATSRRCTVSIEYECRYECRYEYQCQHHIRPLQVSTAN